MEHEKIVSVLLMMLVVGGLAFGCFGDVKAQSTMPKPSIPEFTVSVTDHSYDVPTTTTTTTDLDGRIITTTTPGYHMINGSIEVSIKNQPFTPYYDSDGYPTNLYYHIRIKLLDPDPTYWRYIPGEDQYFSATNSTYTVVTYGYQDHSFVDTWGGMPAYSSFKADGSIDFEVEAFIGHTNTTYRFSGAPVIRSEDLIVRYVGQTSGWSSTQTATIPNGAYTPIIPTPLPTPPHQTASQNLQSPEATQNPTDVSFRYRA